MEPKFLLVLLGLLLSALPIVQGASASMLLLLTDDQLEKVDRSKLVKAYKKTTKPKNDFLIDHDCQFGTSEEEDGQRKSLYKTTPSENDQTCHADRAQRRSVFPAQEPLVCLAFLSCCGRTNLLQATMNAVIRHMEEDEPQVLGQHYEIAWIDNGSPREKQDHIKNTFEVDHALAMPRNMGLAWGMNALIFDMCTAPYILLLEEDWLYMDASVAEPTLARKHAIANAIALLETKPVDKPTNRPLKGVFLRTESNIVKTREGMVRSASLSLPSSPTYSIDNLEYRISCMNLQQSGHIFGAFTNGAGLYEREALMEVGRMYGEPGDVFSDLSVEGNYCFRVGLQYCAARLIMDDVPECDFDTNPNVPPTCAAVFAHIGGGRGTRPARRKHMKCIDDAWNFYGTPFYDQVPKAECSKDLGTIWSQLKINEEFQRVNDLHNEEVFAKEKKQREAMIQMADLFEPKVSNPEDFRKMYGANDPQYASMSDEEIRNLPTKLRNMAKSEHQLPGFWDILGRPLGVDFDMPDHDDE